MLRAGYAAFLFFKKARQRQQYVKSVFTCGMYVLGRSQRINAYAVSIAYYHSSSTLVHETQAFALHTEAGICLTPKGRAAGNFSKALLSSWHHTVSCGRCTPMHLSILCTPVHLSVLCAPVHLSVFCTLLFHSPHVQTHKQLPVLHEHFNILRSQTSSPICGSVTNGLRSADSAVQIAQHRTHIMQPALACQCDSMRQLLIVRQEMLPLPNCRTHLWRRLEQNFHSSSSPTELVATAQHTAPSSAAWWLRCVLPSPAASCR